jgi:hypothetical protein
MAPRSMSFLTGSVDGWKLNDGAAKTHERT